MKPQWTRFLLPWVTAPHRSGQVLKIWTLYVSTEGIPTTLDNLEQRRCGHGYFFTAHSEVWVYQCRPELLTVLLLINQSRLCWTQAHSQLLPATTPCWYFASYCQAAPSTQNHAALGLKQKISATKCSFKSLPQKSPVPKTSFPWLIPCTQQLVNHSSWLPTHSEWQTWKKLQSRDRMIQITWK